MHKELAISLVITILFAGAVIGVLWVQQPGDLNVTTNILKHTDNRIGITPDFDPLSREAVSYYQITIKAEENRGREDDFSFRKSPDEVSDNFETAWFTNDNHGECLQITTSVVAYDGHGDRYQSDEVLDCVSSIPNPYKMSHNKHEELSDSTQQISVSATPYFEEDHRVGFDVNFQATSSADTYEIRRYRKNPNIQLVDSVNLDNPSTIRLSPIKNKNTDTCLNQLVSVSGYNSNDELVSFGKTQRCDSSRATIDTMSQGLNTEVDFQHRWTADPEPQTGIDVAFDPVRNTHHYNVIYKVSSMNGTKQRNQMVFPQADNSRNPDTVWFYNPYNSVSPGESDRNCLQIKTLVKAVNADGNTIASSTDEGCVKHSR